MPDEIRLFVSGDVMTGRGIDQILPSPCDPILYESYVRDARGYVTLAERESGPIPRAVDPAYVWGDALAELEAASPHARIINLETAVTTSAEPWPDKGIHYRMHPAHTSILDAARIDCCCLANNHVLDWGHAGLRETLDVLRARGRTAGAGHDVDDATAPAVLDGVPGHRVLVFACGSPNSGIPLRWAATPNHAGVHLLPGLTERAADRLAAIIERHKGPGDRVVLSIHWGGNWGFAVPAEQRAFAHRLIATGSVDLVHGHSSHHVKALEIYRDKLVLYGCGDFLNDYEGISGHSEFRGELGLMYFPRLDPATGALLGLRLTPMRTTRFQPIRADVADRRWLGETLNRESSRFGVRVEMTEDGAFEALPVSVSLRG